MDVLYVLLLRVFWRVALPYNTTGICLCIVRVGNTGTCLFLKACSAFFLPSSGESRPGTECLVLATCQTNCGDLSRLRCKEAEQLPTSKFVLHCPMNWTTNVSVQSKIHRPCSYIPALQDLAMRFANSPSSAQWFDAIVKSSVPLLANGEKGHQHKCSLCFVFYYLT